MSREATAGEATAGEMAAGEVAATEARPRVLITGGAGFIGSNLADHLLTQGVRVRILDSLTRRGSQVNLRWLRERHAEGLEAITADVRDAAVVREAVRDTQHVVHLAAQVAVTLSLQDPRYDFAVNALGTLNLLEAIRCSAGRPSLVYCSTNKVYGALPDVTLAHDGQRYEPADRQLAARGLCESRPLDFHSPYGCSKGAADQYVIDYTRSFGLRAVVLRMSCIYGPRQQGTEDQGWVAHFLRCALAGEPLTIYGDGMQVRDLLFVQDLVEALECVRHRIDGLSGAAYNIGGGPQNTLSLLELLHSIERLTGIELRARREPWRVGDQRYYVSDVSRFRERTGWTPRTGIEAGLQQLIAWLRGASESAQPLEHLRAPARSRLAAGQVSPP